MVTEKKQTRTQTKEISLEIFQVSFISFLTRIRFGNIFISLQSMMLVSSQGVTDQSIVAIPETHTSAIPPSLQWPHPHSNVPVCVWRTSRPAGLSQTQSHSTLITLRAVSTLRFNNTPCQLTPHCAKLSRWNSLWWRPKNSCDGDGI